MNRANRWLLPFLLLLTMLSFPALAEKSHLRPFNGTASGYFVYIGPTAVPGAMIHATTAGTGINSELGSYRFTMEQDVTFHPDGSGTIVGTLYCIAANGDWLVVDASGTISTDGNASIHTTSPGALGLVGSTGRFANAIVDAWVTGPGQQPDMSFGPLHWNGTISY